MELVKSPISASSHELTDEDEDPRKILEVAVEGWIRRGENIPFRDVPHIILEEISHYFPPHHETWKVLASELYVKRKPTLLDLDKIEGDAYVDQKWPSLVLLCRCTTDSNLSFSTVLKVLYAKLKRMDCLQSLYDKKYVEEFLEYRENQMKLLTDGSREVLSELMDHSNNAWLKSALDDLKFRKNYKPKFDPEGLAENSTIRDILQIVQACKIPCNTKSIANNDDDKKLVSQELLQNSCDRYTQSKSSNLKTHLSGRVVILLTYSVDVNNDIPTLVQKFWDAGIGVVAEWVLRGKGYLETNPMDVWENYFKQSNFVVPVLSPKYLKDVETPSNNEQARWVRFIYTLYTRKYMTDGCLNNVVRPLVMPTVNGRRLQKANPTLSMGWRLEEIDDFIDMLKNCSR